MSVLSVFFGSVIVIFGSENTGVLLVLMDVVSCSFEYAWDDVFLWSFVSFVFCGGDAMGL
jgi:hypothetical protein